MAFLASTGEPPSPGLSVVAIDPSRQIGPDNWQWRLPPQQKRNRRAQKSEYRTRKKKENPNYDREFALRASFGIGISEYTKMLEAQNGVCAICGRPEARLRNGRPQSLCVDHCHTTGRLRGLLCSACNRSIGLMKDNAQRLRAAAEYLERHQSARSDDIVKFAKKEP
ncbi:MAG: endonuclease VII domain-containing protein [Patescibacteria group bacterium]|nr:endonuclease VII domain-containing protein [Patescibacteria group bacterium]